MLKGYIKFKKFEAKLKREGEGKVQKCAFYQHAQFKILLEGKDRLYR